MSRNRRDVFGSKYGGYYDRYYDADYLPPDVREKMDARAAEERSRQEREREERDVRHDQRHAAGSSAPGLGDVLTTSMLGLIAGPEAILKVAQNEVSRTACKNLPCLGTTLDEAQKWIDVGFKLGDPIPDQFRVPLFRHAEWPEGWSLGPVDDSGIWRQIYDDRGRPRGQYGYKGAYWDPFAGCSLSVRYRIDYGHIASSNTNSTPLGRHARVITDGAYDWRDSRRIMHVFETPVVEPVKPEHMTDERFAALNAEQRAYMIEDQRGAAAEKLAIAWLQEHKPLYRDLAAYWDEP